MRHIQKWFVALLYIAIVPTALNAQSSPQADPIFLPPPLLDEQPLPAQLFQAQNRVQNLYRGAATFETTPGVLRTSAEVQEPPLVPPAISDSLAQVTWNRENIYSDSNPYYETSDEPFTEDGYCECNEAADDPPLPFGLEWTKHRLTTTVLPGGNGGLGMTTIDLRTQFALSQYPMVQVTPRFRWHFLDGPDFTDLPSHLFGHAVDFTLYLPLKDQWSFYGGIAPGLYSDHDNTSSDAFRLTGQALFFYKRSEQLKFAFGFIYLDREDVSALPVAGVTYVPEGLPDLKFDIMFPKPKISYRYFSNGTRERSIYLSGEFGGGTWAIERASGVDDVATYGDLKLALGVEHKQTGGATWFLEGGYVFSRDLEYSSGAEFDLDDTGMIRVGLAY